MIDSRPTITDHGARRQIEELRKELAKVVASNRRLQTRVLKLEKRPPQVVRYEQGGLGP